MEYRILGKTGLKVSVVSLGMAYLRERAVLFKALDLGINYFDTAQEYMGGNNERMLGDVLKEYGRKKVFIATKIYPFHQRTKLSDRLRVLEKNVLNDMMEESLRRLSTDYVDVFFIHRVPETNCLSDEDLLLFLEKLKKKGMARFVGVSHHDANIFVDVADHVSKHAIYDVLLVWFNFESPQEHINALKRARKQNVGIVAMKTQAGGYENTFTDSVNPMQSALKWVLEKDFVDCAIPGIRNIEQLETDVEVIGKKMAWNDRKILHGYYQSIKHQYCIMCGQCFKTCSNTIDITTINRALMYCEGYRDFEQGRRTYRELKKKQNGLACISCPSPTCRCTNGINIAQRMKYAHSLFV
jgi:aryl-alcohol dehydrogenase-like predicted oxidoreductase